MKNNKSLTLKILSQSFYPDFVAAGELLYELATKLHTNYDIDISIITAQPNFIKKERLPKTEILNGLKIKRLTIFNFDKNSLKGKILNAHSFFYSVMHHLNWAKKVDWLLIPTSPPLLPLMGTYAKLIKGQKYIYLMHDVYPESANKLGYIKKDGIIYKLWDYLSKLSLNKADKIIALSDSMKQGIIEWVNNIDPEKIHVIHNWADENIVKVISKQNNYFLDQYNLKDKFIIEYSGNIGRVHEFKTIINTAKELQDDKNIVFLFIGEGGKKAEVEKLVNEYNLKNVHFLPYQERKDLSYSLGMADIHILSLQYGYEHLVAPCKLYGIFASGKPSIFVGSKDCYITKILEDNKCGFNVKIGDAAKLKETIMTLKNFPDTLTIYGKNSRKLFEENYTLEKSAKAYFDIMKK